MPKDNRPLHERREVTFAELGALFGVREMLRTGALNHTILRPAKSKEHLFNMSTAGETFECGSIACIGGNMAIILSKRNISQYVAGRNPSEDKEMYYTIYEKIKGDIRSPSLASLFFPPRSISWDKIDNKIAIKAINNWLKNGKPRWEQLIKPYR